MARKLKSSRPVNPTEEALMNIYKDSDGHVPDLSHFDHRRPTIHPFFWGALVFVLLIGAASAVSVYFFAPLFTTEAQESRVRLFVEGPKEVASGSKATYIVTYVNDERVALRDVVIRVRPSSGFTIDHADPKVSGNGNAWTIGRLAPGDHGSIQLVGTAVGNPETPLAMEAAINYARDNFSSTLVERSSIETRVTPAPITMTIDGPDQIVYGEATTFTVNATNNGDAPILTIAARIRLPHGATMKDLPKNVREEKEASTDGNEGGTSVLWVSVGAIGPNDTVGIPLTFVLQPVVGSTASSIVPSTTTLEGDIGLFVHDEFFAQVQTTITLEVVEGGFVVKLAANGVQGEGTVGWEEAVTTTVSYENRGKVAAENVEIRVAVSGDALDWATLADTKKGVVKNGEIRWTKRELSGLALVKAGGTGTMTFSVRLRAPGDEALQGKASAAHVRIEGTALIGKFGKTTKDVVVTMTPVDLAVNTDAQFRAQLRYFSEENIAYGTGPLPPRVGEATTYRVFLKVENRLHELQSIVARAKLPLFTEWTGRTVVAAGEMKYDPITREVQWALNRMPTTVEKLESQFEVRFIPVREHAKTTVTLIPEIQFDARDGVTQGNLHATVGPLTTALPDDPEAKGKGIIIE